jgi:hypothetical protein
MPPGRNVLREEDFDGAIRGWAARQDDAQCGRCILLIDQEL